MSLKQNYCSKSKKKNLHVTFKAKDKIYNNDCINNVLKKRLHSDLQENRLLVAASTNNTDTVRELLEAGADPNSVDIQSRSALHLSASRGYMSIVELLLNYGANPNIKDIIGNTPLHLAACTNNLPIITALLNAGGDVSSLDTYGRNPLQLAQSKLLLLQHNKKNGIIEMTHLKLQLQHIIDIMISMKKQQNKTSNDGNGLEDLELMKLSINSGTDELVEDQMSRLMTELEQFTIK